MGQVTSVGIPPLALPIGNQHALAAPVPREAREATRQVATAVRYLNSTNYAGQGREITFSLDPTTHLPIVKVIDTVSKEVLQQWPREYAVRVAAAEIQHKGAAGAFA